MQALIIRIFGHSLTTVFGLLSGILIAAGEYLATGQVTKAGLTAACIAGLTGALLKNPNFAWLNAILNKQQ